MQMRKRTRCSEERQRKCLLLGLKAPDSWFKPLCQQISFIFTQNGLLDSSYTSNWERYMPAAQKASAISMAYYHLCAKTIYLSWGFSNCCCSGTHPVGIWHGSTAHVHCNKSLCTRNTTQQANMIKALQATSDDLRHPRFNLHVDCIFTKCRYKKQCHTKSKVIWHVIFLHIFVNQISVVFRFHDFQIIVSKGQTWRQRTAKALRIHSSSADQSTSLNPKF